MAAIGGFDSGFSSGFNKDAAICYAGGNLTFAGGLGRNISKTVGGNLVPVGILGRDISRTAGGLLTFYGSLQATNPDWLLIPDYLNWTGLWSGATTYAEGDAVLFVDGTLHHAFASRKGTIADPNLNHSVLDPEWWYRIGNEPWRKV